MQHIPQFAFALSPNQVDQTLQLSSKLVNVDRNTHFSFSATPHIATMPVGSSLRSGFKQPRSCATRLKEESC